MTRTPFENISRFYDSRVIQYGHDPKACDYGRAESQIRKFEVLSEVCNLDSRSVLDVGCGFADYASFLNQRYRNFQYAGIDLSEQMIDHARRRHPHLDLRVGNILDSSFSQGGIFDVVTANGIFYLLGENATKLMQNLVQSLFEHARVAVAFNSLSTWAEKREEHEYYADPLETVQWCSQLTKNIILRHDYMPHDFTVFLYKKD